MEPRIAFFLETVAWTLGLGGERRAEGGCPLHFAACRKPHKAAMRSPWPATIDWGGFVAILTTQYVVPLVYWSVVEGSPGSCSTGGWPFSQQQRSPNRQGGLRGAGVSGVHIRGWHQSHTLQRKTEDPSTRVRTSTFGARPGNCVLAGSCVAPWLTQQHACDSHRVELEVQETTTTRPLSGAAGSLMNNPRRSGIDAAAAAAGASPRGSPRQSLDPLSSQMLEELFQYAGELERGLTTRGACGSIRVWCAWVEASVWLIWFF